MGRRSLLFKLRAGAIFLVFSGLFSLCGVWYTLDWLGGKAEDLTTETSSLLQVTRKIPELSLKVGSFPARLLDSTQAAELAEMRRETQITFSEIIPLASLVGENEGLDFKSGQSAFQDLLAVQEKIIAESTKIDALVNAEILRLNRMSRAIRQARSSVMLDFVTAAAETSERQSSVNVLFEFSEFESNVTTLIVLTQSLPTLPAEAALGLRPNVIRQIDAMTTTLGRLPESSERSALAKDMNNYRAAFLGLGGGFDMVVTLVTLEQSRRALLDQAIGFVGTLVDWSENVTNKSTADFQMALVNIQNRIAAARSIGVTVTLFFWIGCVLLFWYLLEMRLFRRLARITGHIREMNDGHLSTALRVSGKDEVGEVEEAVDRARILARDLTDRNEELHRFAYVAAHDLRAPLRAVKSLISWTIEDHGDVLPDEARENLDTMDARLTRLSELLAALLDYARAGQVEEEIGVFDLTEFASDLRQVYFPDKNFEILIAGIPPVIETYPTPIQTILLNLVSNAIKHHDRPDGRIVLDAAFTPTGMRFRVSDDGPGIPKKYQDRIFVLFQTLKSRDDVEGSGLGLALIQKLAISFGGSVFVLSNPEVARGCVFEVHLPFGAAVKPFTPKEIAA